MSGSADIARAVQVLRSGGLVAFPTETVYGLGADATSAAAVSAIFRAKGRPATNPLIAHVCDEEVARQYARRWPDAASRLARKFWPGPLTIVVPKNPAIVPEATAGLETVGLRAPDHPMAIEMLRQFDGPVAAPSANRSNRVSPTTAQHVREELGDSVDFILDGGPCRVGIESTVLDLCGDVPRILRPGAVTAEQIEAEIGPVERGAIVVDASTAAQSPGQQPVHYAPQAAAYRFDSTDLGRVLQWCRDNANRSWAILGIEPMRFSSQTGDILDLLSEMHRLVEMSSDPAEYGRHLYAMLRALDSLRVEVILIEIPPDEPRWSAVRDRLIRATRPI